MAKDQRSREVRAKSLVLGLYRQARFHPSCCPDIERGEGHIQNIFPHLTPGQREFIMTGITDDEWDETFKEE